MATSRFAARSASLLRSLNIRFILSVTQLEDVPKFQSRLPDEPNTSNIEYDFIMKHIEIHDSPTEDILFHLTDACCWIETNLRWKMETAKSDDPNFFGVLVHCTQGISRSGAIVVAYCKCFHPTSHNKYRPTMVLSLHLTQ
jgi:dual specificity phosphatase 12